MYMYTNLVCVETETSAVESASNLTKPLQRCGRAKNRKVSSDLVKGKVFTDCTLLYMYTNLVTRYPCCIALSFCCVVLPCLVFLSISME